MEIEMLMKTKIALAAAFLLGSASGVLANDDDTDKGGFVVPGSRDGVNPALHRDDPAAVQSPKQPMSPEKGIQTEGRGPERLPLERLPLQKDEKPSGQADEGEK